MARIGDSRTPGLQILRERGGERLALLVMADRAWRYPYVVPQPETVRLRVVAGAATTERDQDVELPPDEVRGRFRTIAWSGVPAALRPGLAKAARELAAPRAIPCPPETVR